MGNFFFAALCGPARIAGFPIPLLLLCFFQSPFFKTWCSLQVTFIAPVNIQIHPVFSTNRTFSLVPPVEHEMAGVTENNAAREIKILIDGVRSIPVWMMC
jgi:hypothetical protein